MPNNSSCHNFDIALKTKFINKLNRENIDIVIDSKSSSHLFYIPMSITNRSYRARPCSDVIINIQYWKCVWELRIEAPLYQTDVDQYKEHTQRGKKSSEQILAQACQPEVKPGIGVRGQLEGPAIWSVTRLWRWGEEGKSFRGRKTTVISTHAGSLDKRCLCSWYKQGTNQRPSLQNFTFGE